MLIHKLRVSNDNNPQEKVLLRDHTIKICNYKTNMKGFFLYNLYFKVCSNLHLEPPRNVKSQLVNNMEKQQVVGIVCSTYSKITQKSG